MKKVYLILSAALSSALSFAQAPIAHFPLDDNFESNVEGVNIEMIPTAEAVFEFVPGQVNNACTFIGAGQYSVELEQYLTTSSNWTLSLWCRAGGQATSYATILEKGESLFLRFQNNNLEFGYYNGTEWATNMPFGSFTDNQWHHYTLRYEAGENNSSLNLLIDGQTNVTVSLPSTWQSLHNMCIFGIGTNDGLFNTLKGFNGTLDDIQIFPLLLTDSEVAEVINNSSSTHINDTAALSLGVYPNPTSEWVTIDIPSNLIGARVSVVNINGQVVLEELANAQKLNLNVSSLATGNYTVTVKNGDAILSSTLIKQ